MKKFIFLFYILFCATKVYAVDYFLESSTSPTADYTEESSAEVDTNYANNPANEDLDMNDFNITGVGTIAIDTATVTNDLTITGHLIVTSSTTVSSHTAITGDLTVTGNVSGATYGSDSSVTDAELLYLDATSSIQTQMDLKISLSSAVATYLQLSSATATYLQLSSATATYLQLSSATATYLELSSATATYLEKSSGTMSSNLTVTGTLDVSSHSVFVGDITASTITSTNPDVSITTNVVITGDLTTNMTTAPDQFLISQSAVSGVETQSLVFINDDRTGLTANERDEAALTIDAEGMYALNVTDGQSFFLNIVEVYGSLGVITDNASLFIGATGISATPDFAFGWDNNGTGDDLLKMDSSPGADDTDCWLWSQTNPNNCSDTDDFVAPTFGLVNEGNADTGDGVVVFIGYMGSTDVAVANYFDFCATTIALDGSADATTAEIAPTFRFTGYVEHTSSVTVSSDVAVIGYLGIKESNELRFYDSDSSNYIGLESSATVTANNVYVLPASTGVTGQYLNNTSGVMGWGTPAGAGDTLAAGDETITGDWTFSGYIDSEQAINAFVVFCGTGTVHIYDSYNVSSVDDNDTGSYTVNWDTDFSSIYYAIGGFAGSTTASSLFASTAYEVATSSARINIRDHAGNNTDSDKIRITAIGDQ